MMSLFNVNSANIENGYRNLRDSTDPDVRGIRTRIEELWQQYEPYADTDFETKFAREMDSRFWEMYLAVQLLNAGKNLRRRSHCEGPDICIEEDGRKIWIEATVPTRGNDHNPNRVPNLVSTDEDDSAQTAPRRQVELRISGKLRDKKKAYLKYLEKGIVSRDDHCIVAISYGGFSPQVSPYGLPVAVTAVYPIGAAQFLLNPETHEFKRGCYEESSSILRVGKEGIDRRAFLNKYYSIISGIVWSNRHIGNFFDDSFDLCFVHNFVASNSIPKEWASWHEEYVAEDCNEKVRVSLVRS